MHQTMRKRKSKKGDPFCLSPSIVKEIDISFASAWHSPLLPALHPTYYALCALIGPGLETVERPLPRKLALQCTSAHCSSVASELGIPGCNSLPGTHCRKPLQSPCNGNVCSPQPLLFVVWLVTFVFVTESFHLASGKWWI